MHSIVRFADAVLVEVNETFTKTLGYSRDEVIGKTPFELNFWVAPERLHSYVESGKPSATWLGVPLSIRGKPFGVMAVQDYHDVAAYGEEEKEILAFVATQTALAIERKRAQQALQESEQKFRALFEGSSQGVMIQDGEKFLEVNSATLRMLGFESSADVLGKHPKDTSPPFQPNGESSESASRRHIAECMEHGSARFEWVGLNARREPVPFEVILTRVELGGRRVIQAVINDISERKKAEAELRASEARLRESEARFSTAFHASPVLITVARLRDKTFVEVNEAFLRWMGLERAEIVGRNSEELDLWANLEERKEFFAELQRTRSLRNIESQLRRGDGAVRTVLISANIIEINGDPHVLGFGLDITDSKRAEAELQKALEKERELTLLLPLPHENLLRSREAPSLPILPAVCPLERTSSREIAQDRRGLFAISKSPDRFREEPAAYGADGQG